MGSGGFGDRRPAASSGASRGSGVYKQERDPSQHDTAEEPFPPQNPPFVTGLVNYRSFFVCVRDFYRHPSMKLKGILKKPLRKGKGNGARRHAHCKDYVNDGTGGGCDVPSAMFCYRSIKLG